jgi:hypothetical protein
VAERRGNDAAYQPGDRAARQRAVERSLAMLPEMRSAVSDWDPDIEGALSAARVAVMDLMLFVGVVPNEARAATRPTPREDPSLHVPPPHAPAQRSRIAQFRDRVGDRLKSSQLWTRLRRGLSPASEHPSP